MMSFLDTCTELSENKKKYHKSEVSMQSRKLSRSDRVSFEKCCCIASCTRFLEMRLSVYLRAAIVVEIFQILRGKLYICIRSITDLGIRRDICKTCFYIFIRSKYFYIYIYIYLGRFSKRKLSVENFL